ncbi:MAG: ABC transporter permease subunit [Kofleriaceae bacterium]|nr:ABC transporter permease subunit [Kofleriaceae bacterium]
MHGTKAIFFRELGAYVRSPLGWVIASVLLLVDGILFQTQALSGAQLSAVVLERFFWSTSGVVMIAAIALSIRLIAEERQNHSIVLLTTSPVRDSAIVAGKFFAALTFLAIVLVLSLYMPLLIKVNGKITAAQIAVGYAGLLLLGAAALAIGMFASSLTRQQLVAAVLGAAILTLMVMLFPLAKRVDSPLREVLAELDLWWVHFQNGFMRGVLNVKDVIYYIAVTYFFLLLSVKTLEAKRWQ